jgi:hypothetical protein
LRGHTWHDGFYGKRGVRGYFQHPRFRCRPERGQPQTHAFTTHRRLLPSGDPYCEYCERQRGVDDGPRTPTHYQFGIVEIATTLYELASGSSYRGASRLRRFSIGRPARALPVDRRSGDDRTSNQGHLARDWLEEFAPVVLAGKEPRRWPRILVLDCRGYHPRLRPGRPPGSFYVFAAYDGLAHQIVQLGFYPARYGWWHFLDQLPGEPEVVIADDAAEIHHHVTTKWPRARYWHCHWHLQRQLHNDAVPRDSVIPPGHRLAAEIDAAFSSPQNWSDFVAACRVELAENARVQRWLDAKADIIAEQIADADFTPRTTGALEQRLRQVGDRIGERRGFANKERTDLLLRLWATHLNHRAHLDEFIRKVRRHLETTGGRPRPHSRPGGRRAATGLGHGEGRCRCHPGLSGPDIYHTGRH